MHLLTLARLANHDTHFAFIAEGPVLSSEDRTHGIVDGGAHVTAWIVLGSSERCSIKDESKFKEKHPA